MKNWTARVPLAFTFATALGLAASAAGQEPPSGLEAGGHVSSLFSPLSPSTAGIAGRIALPVAPRVAIDARVTLFPERRQPAFLAQGGRTIELQLGVRGTFIARRRFSVYGVLLPGLVRVTDTITAISNQSSTMGAATHVALDMGTGVEFRPGARWSAYAEWTGPMYAVRGTELGRSSPSPSGAVAIAELPASIESSAQFNAGLSYRFGRAHERSPEAAGHWRGTAGTQAGHTTYSADFGGTNLMRSPTIGAFGSAGVFRWLDADAAFDALLRREAVHSPQGGGRVLQTLAGVKAGTRSKFVGYFAKLRAGVRTRDSSVTASLPDRRPAFGRSTVGVLDYGAVIEAYVGRRLLVRLDAGDLVSFYQNVAEDSINVALGMGWRIGG